MSLIDIDGKILHNILANWIQQFIKIINHDQVGNSPGMQGIWKSISVIHQIERLNKKNHMMLSVNSEKAIDEIQYLFPIKTLNLGVSGSYLNVIKNKTLH